MKAIADFLKTLLDLFLQETHESRALVTDGCLNELYLEVEIVNFHLRIYGQRVRVPAPYDVVSEYLPERYPGPKTKRYVLVEYQFVNGLVTRPKLVR